MEAAARAENKTPDEWAAEAFAQHLESQKWQKLVAFGHENAKAHGETRVGVKALFERLRWSYNRATVGDSWRLNNSYTSRYARLIAAERPDLAPLFETRKLRAA